jgi:hypothetical protein
VSNKIRIVNIKRGMPTVVEARELLKQALEAARRDKVAVIKLIHGYGSSGIGGALRDALRSSLRRRAKEGVIAAFVPGESWDIFEPAARQILESCPELGRDSDLNKQNEGVTIILLLPHG